jgi:AcrR family transcriptional regulator
MPGRSDVRPEAVDVAGPSADATSTSRRRPKDRADQILLAAAQLFRERGYHAVGIDDIGAAVGISGPSVYRHFDSKEALLVAATERAASRYGSMYGEALAAVTPQERVAGIVRRSVTGAIEDRDISAIYYREYRHIARERRQPIQRMIEELREQWVAPLVAVRPELTREQARFLWRSVSGLNRSIVYFPRPPMPRTRWVETLTRMGLAAVLAGPRHVDGQDGDTAMTVAQVLPVLVANDPESSREPSVFSTTVSRGSRREAILAVAVRLFRQHGYGGVGI